MASLGYRAKTTEMGVFKIDTGEFVSYTTYYAKWKWDYPNLNASRPVEDICIVYADNTMSRTGRDNNYEDDDLGQEANDDIGDDNNPEVVEELNHITERVNFDQPDSASDKVAEEREEMMLEAAE